jgi:DNA invertase Pin-like site-specific DNA recombinase
MFWRHRPALQEAIAELDQGGGEILVADVSN